MDELSEQARHGYVSPTFFTWALAAVGETEEALDRLEEACEEKSPPLSMHQATLLRPLHGERRFREIRRRMGLKPL